MSLAGHVVIMSSGVSSVSGSGHWVAEEDIAIHGYILQYCLLLEHVGQSGVVKMLSS